MSDIPENSPKEPHADSTESKNPADQSKSSSSFMMIVSATSSTNSDPGKKGKAGEDSEKKPDPKDKDDSEEDQAGDQSEARESKPKDDSDDQKPKKPPIYKRPGFIIGVSIATIVILITVLIIWLIERQYVSTDDAYVDGHVVQISPQINARVLALNIEDNQFVHKGDLLVQLDPTDFQVALEQARAQVASAGGRLAQAQAQVESARAAVTQAVAREQSSKASLENATRDLERYQKVDERARSRQQLDTSATSQTNATADLKSAHAQLVTARANVTAAEASVAAAAGDLQSAQAQQRQAEVNLSYCRILAPMDGRITERTVEAGNYATTGEVFCMLVDPDVWVTANLKETQLTLLRPGQPVTISVDAFPGRKFQGRVDSIQAGTGARFSVLPAENATGNYVKIVQRVPVKILFEHDANTNDAPMLSPGLSVEPRIKVR